MSINQTQNYVLSQLPEATPLAVDKVFLNTNGNNSIAIYPSEETVKISPDFSTLGYSLDPCGLSGDNPVFGIKNVDKNSFSLYAKKTQICMRIPITSIFPDIKKQLSGQTKELLFGLSAKYQGDNSVNMCLAQLDHPGCLYYLSKNLILKSGDTQNIQQYLAITGQDNLDNLGIRIAFDTTKDNVLKEIRYSDFSFSLTTPTSITQIKSGLLNSSLANIKAKKTNNYQITAPFTGIQDLSKDITTLPRTTGDCPSQNSKGENPASALLIKNQIGQYIRYSSENGSFCDHFSYQNLPHNQSYAISIVSRNLKGLSLRLCVINNSSNRCDIYADLSSSPTFKQENFLLPPMGEGNGYDIDIDNFAVKGLPSVNDLKSISIVPVPYTWMSQIETVGSELQGQISKRIMPESVQHLNQSLYLVTTGQANNNVLALSQAYEKNWKAYTVNKFNILNETLPFLFGREVKQHILVNNWENGWVLQPENGNKNIIIVYLPQYLEYAGLIILVLPVLIVILRFLASRRSSKRPLRVDF